MLRTTNVSTLRADLSSFLDSLDEGPVLVLSHSKPKAVLMDHELFEALLRRVEVLEDLVDGRRALAETQAEPGGLVDAEDVFRRLGR